jgi:hypothetical protein
MAECLGVDSELKEQETDTNHTHVRDRRSKRSASDIACTPNSSHTVHSNLVCLTCATESQSVSVALNCGVSGCDGVCALCTTCIDTFSGLENCVTLYPYCCIHHPIVRTIEQVPHCLVDGCTVRLDGGDNDDYVCERREHPYQMMPLRISKTEHRYTQIRLWIETHTLLNGDIAKCYPTRASVVGSSNCKNNTKRRRFERSRGHKIHQYTTSEAAILESVTTQGWSWDHDQYKLGTLSKATRLQIVTYLLNARHGVHFQRVICIPGWFHGWTSEDTITLAVSEQCMCCSAVGVTSAQFMSSTVWVCTSNECTHFLMDLCSHMDAAVTQTATGTYVEPVYLSTWGTRCLRSTP